jgi:hypothetical protein
VSTQAPKAPLAAVSRRGLAQQPNEAMDDEALSLVFGELKRIRGN